MPPVCKFTSKRPRAFQTHAHDGEAVEGGRWAGVQRFRVRPLQPRGYADPDTPIKVSIWSMCETRCCRFVPRV